MQNNTSLKINFNRKFYKLPSIKTAIRDFQNICKGSVKESEGYFLVTLAPKNKSLHDNLGHEFSNYVLALMKNEVLV